VDGLDDAELWPRVINGDGRAFAAVFDRHRGRVHRHSLGLVARPVDAEDVLAVTFFETWRHRDRIRFVDGSLLPWLLVTATNTARNATRSTKRYQRLLARLPPPNQVADPADSVDGGAASDALARLRLVDQQVLTLCVVLDLSERDAARVLGVSPGTVKSRLHRAKSRMRAHITPAGELSIEGAS